MPSTNASDALRTRPIKATIARGFTVSSDYGPDGNKEEGDRKRCSKFRILAHSDHSHNSAHCSLHSIHQQVRRHSSRTIASPIPDVAPLVKATQNAAMLSATQESVASAPQTQAMPAQEDRGSAIRRPKAEFGNSIASVLQTNTDCDHNAIEIKNIQNIGNRKLPDGFLSNARMLT